MAPHAAPTPPVLDDWLPDAAVRTHHRRTARAEPDLLWRCARRIRLADTTVLGRLVRWRIPGTRDELTYDDMFRGYPFCVLEAGERHLVSGLCGRIWTLQRDYPALDADGFRDWSEPGTVRVLFSHWVAAHGDGSSELCSEARIAPVDRLAALRLKALWAVIGRFEPLVAREPLTDAVARAGGR
jgi:hypothetical protein